MADRFIKEIAKNVLEAKGFRVEGFSKIYGTDDISVTVEFKNPNIGLKKTVVIPMKDVRNGKKFNQYIPNGFAVSDVKPAQQAETLRKAINQALTSDKIKIETALPQGFSIVRGKCFYVLGENILPYNRADGPRPEDRIEYFAADNPEHFVLNTERKQPVATFQEIFAWVKTYCSQGHAQEVLFLCSLTPYLKYVLTDMPVSGHLVNAYVVGQSGVGKTEQIKLLAAVTKTHYGISLESDKSRIMDFLSKLRDRAVLVDDLNLTASENQKSKKETRLSELIQMTCSAGDISFRDGSADLSGIVLMISAEYLLSNPSTVNRCVVLNIKEAFSPEVMTQLQRYQYLYVSFILRFIGWLCRCRMVLATKTKAFFENMVFNIPGADKEEAYIGFRRVYNHYKILKATAFLVHQFFVDEKEADLLKKSMDESINLCIGDTLKSLSKFSKKSDLIEAFLECFEEKKMITENPIKYFGEKKDRMFFLYGEYLFFKGDVLAAYLSEYLEKNVSTISVSKELKDVNLLVPFGKSSSERLPAAISEFDRNTRYYRISIRILKDMLISKYGPIGYVGFELHCLLRERKEAAEEKALQKAQEEGYLSQFYEK